MIRQGSLILCGTLAASLLACGGGGESSSAKDPLDLVPIDQTVSGWTVDQSISKTPGARAMVARTLEEAVSFIDGGAAPFYKDPYKPKAFLWQNYLNMTLPSAPAPKGASISLYVVEMPSVEQTRGLYAALLEESDYFRKEWQQPTPGIGAESRIQDTGNAWWVNFHQGVFYVELSMYPSYGPPPDYTISDPALRAEALRFAQAIANRM